ncbi:V-type ATPase subunit [Gudongella sp. SC589]|jgi:V/A-type H+-transporting ATPase subunit C|uniref:V-type ATPase subunit n=1 Tax=Gudongella sp. SC589 TaxID=3385990 RepID=UPI00390477C8
MGNERRFSAINTKIRVMRSRFLKDDDYIILMEREKVEDQIKYLKENTVYGEHLQDMETLDDIQHVELQLDRFLVMQFKKIVKYFSDDYEKLFKALMFRYETEDLKLYLRALARGEDLEKSVKISVVRSTYYSFSYDKIKTAKSLDDFIEKLKGTKFYDVLYPYRHEAYSKLLFYMEMNLDRLYFSHLSEAAQKLSRRDREIFNELLGENIDLLNIEWIYRGLKFYSLLPEELINYTLPNGRYFEYKDLKDLCYGDIEHLKEVVSGTKYKELVNEDRDIDLYMEIRIQRHLYDKFKNSFTRGKLDISISIAYIHLLEFEIRDIISILEAKKYGLSYFETKDYLVRTIKGSGE